MNNKTKKNQCQNKNTKKMKKNRMVQQQFRWPPNGTNKKQKEHDQKKKTTHRHKQRAKKLKRLGGLHTKNKKIKKTRTDN